MFKEVTGYVRHGTINCGPILGFQRTCLSETVDHNNINKSLLVKPCFVNLLFNLAIKSIHGYQCVPSGTKNLMSKLGQ